MKGFTLVELIIVALIIGIIAAIAIPPLLKTTAELNERNKTHLTHKQLYEKYHAGPAPTIVPTIAPIVTPTPTVGPLKVMLPPSPTLRRLMTIDEFGGELK